VITDYCWAAKDRRKKGQNIRVRSRDSCCWSSWRDQAGGIDDGDRSGIKEEEESRDVGAGRGVK
jgi:hypothetical protein